MKALRLLLTLTLCWLACASESRAYMTENRVWEKSGYPPVMTGKNELQAADGQWENCPAYGECASGQEVWSKFDPEGLDGRYATGNWLIYTAATASEGAMDGANRFVNRFNQGLMGILMLPQTVANAGGATAGYVTSLVDGGTRGTTVNDTGKFLANNARALGSADEWKRAGTHLLSPEWMADT